MTTDPGDLVLDPTCGSGTAAYVGEQWGRRWITIDTSRVALALARARVMGARYPYYLLVDSPEGLRKESEVDGRVRSELRTDGDVRQGFVCERVPHITLKSIANNAEIDFIWERWQETLEPLREDLNARLDCDWEEWQIPREVVGGLAGGGGRDASAVVGGAHRPAAGDRRVHRGQGGLRVPLRQALRGQPQGARGRARSRSRACRRTAWWRSTRTTSSWTASRRRRPTTGRSRTSRA